MQKPHEKSAQELNSIRDTAESIWIAIVMAFVLRAFVIEAFVIPTGSMAPRLMGEHWELQCPACGFEYAYGAPAGLPRGQVQPPSGAVCPTCDFPYIQTDPAKLRERRTTDGAPRYVDAGDRVLVMKYLYHFQEPQPFDVVVFRNPQNNRENYIKRLIGLPGETIQLVHGDVFYKSAATGGQWRIRRKPPQAQASMWQVINDNDYQPDPSIFAALKVWEPTEQSADAWAVSQDKRAFVFKGGDREGEIEFRSTRKDQGSLFRPRYGYNQRTVDDHADNSQVVTDLKLAATFMPHDGSAEAILGLTSFNHHFRATLRADGTFKVEHARQDGGAQRPPESAWEDWTPSGARLEAAIPPGQGVEVALTNVDYRLTLWVAGRAVFESTDEEYDANYDEIRDLLASRGGLNVPPPKVTLGLSGGRGELRHVKLMRDVYYTDAVASSTNFKDDPVGDYGRAWRKSFYEALEAAGAHPDRTVSPEETYKHLSEELRSKVQVPPWGTFGKPIELKKDPANPDLDSFFVLGDNSPASLDARAWVDVAPTLRLWKDPNAPPTADNMQYQMGTVPRYNIIGKAFFVYWPSGYRLPLLESLPIVPNVGRMRLIR